MTRDQIIDYIRDVKFGYLATADADGAPRVRPIGITTVYGDDLYFFTFSTTRKVAEMEANPRVEVVWSKLEQVTQVRVSGTASRVEDEATQQRFRQDNPFVAKVIPEEADNLFCLFKIHPEKVYMAQGLVPYTEIAW
jgi:uncharacterized pyridoxamine 5'-phosphate oxidase family protein